MRNPARSLSFSPWIRQSRDKTDTHLEDTHLEDTHLEDTHLEDTHLEDTHLEDTHLEDTGQAKKIWLSKFLTSPFL